ncbi:ECF-type sigma factor [Acanthopleuribacter pedis]|uniref:RNA polymerase sigma-70 ECF-like HTH domain-containing protein n=1 Tax=Acanthopleuribacter pedis TaxID=442870 RepID=A0A8J7U5K6_9BACT|nr:ECF-type sigma factor [Acanthopleuribacter pedis]MBO1321812.1 hypothetical protein [Acanthopleuribacter pedis]
MGQQEITQLLLKWQDGETGTMDELWPAVAQELRKLSRKVLREFVSDNHRHVDLCTTDLLHQAFPKLSEYRGDPDRPWRNRREFYAMAKKILLWVLLNHEKYAHRHGARFDGVDVPQDSLPHGGPPLGPEQLMGLQRALDLLGEIDPVQARIVQLRFFEDATIDNIIKATGMGRSKVFLELKAALGFLRHKLTA